MHYKSIKKRFASLFLYNCTGRPETRSVKLRSVIAHMFYAHEIDYWDKKGVPFQSHMYVPEIHPITMATFHEREDEGHVFKVYT